MQQNPDLASEITGTMLGFALIGHTIAFDPGAERKVAVPQHSVRTGGFLRSQFGLCHVQFLMFTGLLYSIYHFWSTENYVLEICIVIGQSPAVDVDRLPIMGAEIGLENLAVSAERQPHVRGVAGPTCFFERQVFVPAQHHCRTVQGMVYGHVSRYHHVSDPGSRYEVFKILVWVRIQFSIVRTDVFFDAIAMIAAQQVVHVVTDQSQGLLIIGRSLIYAEYVVQSIMAVVIGGTICCLVPGRPGINRRNKTFDQLLVYLCFGGHVCSGRRCRHAVGSPFHRPSPGAITPSSMPILEPSPWKGNLSCPPRTLWTSRIKLLIAVGAVQVAPSPL